MSEYSAYPLSWPAGWKRTKNPSRSRFGSWSKKPTVAVARDSVIIELRRMGVPDFMIVISTNIQLRRDGLPYSNQPEPTDTGAAVYFKFDDKPKVLACDKWKTVGDNLWAIAKTIEATRGIERWGSVTLAQAFAGYAQLVEKTGPSCWETLNVPRTASEEQILSAYRNLAKSAHPDAGGTVEKFNEITQAKNIALATLNHQ